MFYFNKATSSKGHVDRLSNYKQYFDKVNINEIDISQGIKIADIHRI